MKAAQQNRPIVTQSRDLPKHALLTGHVIPNGNGGFTVTPKKPRQEIDSREVAALMGIARSTLSYHVDSKMGQKYLRWRWTTPRKGKRLFEVDSVLAWIEASKDPEFGDHETDHPASSV